MLMLYSRKKEADINCEYYNNKAIRLYSKIRETCIKRNVGLIIPNPSGQIYYKVTEAITGGRKFYALESTNNDFIIDIHNKKGRLIEFKIKESEILCSDFVLKRLNKEINKLK